MVDARLLYQPDFTALSVNLLIPAHPPGLEKARDVTKLEVYISSL